MVDEGNVSANVGSREMREVWGGGSRNGWPFESHRDGEPFVLTASEFKSRYRQYRVRSHSGMYGHGREARRGMSERVRSAGDEFGLGFFIYREDASKGLGISHRLVPWPAKPTERLFG